MLRTMTELEQMAHNSLPDLSGEDLSDQIDWVIFEMQKWKAFLDILELEVERRLEVLAK